MVNIFNLIGDLGYKKQKNLILNSVYKFYWKKSKIYSNFIKLNKSIFYYNILFKRCYWNIQKLVK